MTQLIRNKYNERVKDYEENMRLIAKLERQQRWDQVLNVCRGATEEILNLEHKIAELESRIELGRTRL